MEENENALDDFINNYWTSRKIFDETVKEHAPDAPSCYAEKFSGEFSAAFAGFKLAQDNCVKILRKSLKELLCEGTI